MSLLMSVERDFELFSEALEIPFFSTDYKSKYGIIACRPKILYTIQNLDR